MGLSDTLADMLGELWSQLHSYYRYPYSYKEDPKIKEQLIKMITEMSYLQINLDIPTKLFVVTKEQIEEDVRQNWLEKVELNSEKDMTEEQKIKSKQIEKDIQSTVRKAIRSPRSRMRTIENNQNESKDEDTESDEEENEEENDEETEVIHFIRPNNSSKLFANGSQTDANGVDKENKIKEKITKIFIV